ncbi:uncharacterized protein LOC104899068 isoform X2 [Beta vulgaris subsp. vulgaris]|uniref:uncharacterized protein LOC104899068 isoform X2 n=1 Tax=Beta vulgaris subsp. vulgaris TaxID=3555 RepID=UPI002036E6D6|nr:uncharacterized protein LOC104899068 isoform X2 [Beta vulgaris subsp. vulgaris]
MEIETGAVYAMELETQRKLLKDVFGGSSSSDSDTEGSDELISSIHNLPSTEGKRGLVLQSPPSMSNPNPCWERIAAIDGLWLCNNFLSLQQQSSLLSSIQIVQAMRFGDLPLWALELSDQIHKIVCFGYKETNTGVLNVDKEACVLPSQLLFRDPCFDQLILNVYQPGEGICAHVDLMRFEDGIAIVSLESSCVMHFSPVEGNGEVEVPLAIKIPVYLTPGSLVIMSGDARYLWKHEINRKPGFQVWKGQEIDQKRRTSITLRKLCIS